VAQGGLRNPSKPDILHSYLRFLMTQYEINVAIQTALDNLVNSNRNLYDYWISELFSDANGDYLDESAWNENNVALIEKDVMNQELAVDNS
jgi:predicted ATP-dependent protease